MRRWLPALKDAVTLEGAEYADDAGRKAWFVVQILGTTLCDAEGVVLLFDRRRQSWRTIYDVPSGCTKVLNNPMRRMVVKGDLLLASICSECDGWGYLYQYRDYVVNLRTFRATVLDPEDGLMLPEDHENPVLHEFDMDVLLRSGP